MTLALSDERVDIVSVDSMQVYRGMDIGTAKPTPAEQAGVRHHLIDVCEPSHDMSIVEFRELFDAAIADIERRTGTPLLVGGTGLYHRAVVDRLTPPPQFPETATELEREPDTEVLYRRLVELDPLAASRMEATNRRRVVRALSVTVGSGRLFSSYGPGMDHYPEVEYTIVGVDIDRDVLDARIERRYDLQMEMGFLDEVERLLSAGRLGKTAGQALGYKELAMYLAGELGLAEALELAVTRTRRFARRQQRWFRRDPRIVWIPYDIDPADLVVRFREGSLAGTMDP
jgi:tRNA dimethylallyltransferase